MYRQARFVKRVRVLTFKDVNIEDLSKGEPPVHERHRFSTQAKFLGSFSTVVRWTVVSACSLRRK